MKRFVFIFSICALFSSPALAQGKLVSVGDPEQPVVSAVSNINQHDVWERQIKYRETRIEFARRLKARQETFAAPRREGYQKYKAALEALNQRRSDDANQIEGSAVKTGERLNEYGKAATPPMWKVSDADSEIILVGTMHALPPGLEWQQPALMKAVENADSFWFEAEVDTEEAERKIAHLSKTQRRHIFRYGEIKGTSELLDKNESAQLAVIALKVGVPVNLVRSLPPGAAAGVLQQSLPRDLGFEGESGMDAVLSAEAREREKPLNYFETVEEQLGFLESLPSRAGEEMLFETLFEWDEKTDEFLDLYETWRTGNLEGMDAFVNQRKIDKPAYHEIILRKRNEAWTETIEELMNESGNKPLIAVGAAHLAGTDSVPQMLKAKGYKVEPYGAIASDKISQLETSPGLQLN